MKKYFFSFIPTLLFAAVFLLSPKQALAAKNVTCGTFYYITTEKQYNCTCESGENNFKDYGRDKICCGWVMSNSSGTSDRCWSSNEPENLEPSIDITEGLDSETFDDLNPLKIAGSPVADQLSSPGGIITRLLNFLFPLAGMILFLLISWGGFEMITSASSKEGMEAGKNRVTAAIIGFILLFSTYWMAQIIELVFRIKIL